MYERETRIRREEMRPRPSGPRPKRRRRKRRRSPFLSWFLTVLVVAGLMLFLKSLGQDAVRSAAYTPPKSSGTAAPFQNAEDPDAMPVKAVEPKPKGTAAAEGDWRLTLVNPWNALPEGYEPTLTQLTGGHAVDERCYPDLQDMMDACRAAGNSPLICSSYRSWEKQTDLFENKVSRLKNQGYAADAARTEAAKTVAVPGTSEHQLGLALDIVDTSNQNLDESQERTDVQQWLIAHSWEYGFVLRFPTGKSDITGIIYEPWHYRYVGKDAAKEMHEQDLCLEEYLETLSQ